MITIELVEIFKECHSNFEAFKEKYAKNYSYVAAHFAYRLIFRQHQTCLVLANKVIRNGIRDEVIAILDNVPSEFKQDVHVLVTRISVGTSTVFFSPEDPNHIRGRSPTLVYTSSTELWAVLAPLRLEVLDGIPNLFIRKITKNDY
ncbi:putative DNA packaging protein [Acinetobacter phage vB_AbaM_Lazarus]|uniref:Putative DNA packaging protein n=1 Tax=Acinetobacter phage vB_AbaM_Lazarus TaxID=2686289 RepID=A0A6B9SUM2_9CAUD|nr:putative DNA packaging protein [Acinetobacter phage vB_AbaM_Lazarus]QHJ74106.1 putative DNA packaging protein [Acinetobacter phage vB_AbaM_Lazarus]